MWRTEENMETFRALSFGEKWSIRGYVARGSAPSNPRLARAAIELAESYQRQRLYAGMRWLPGVMIAIGLAGLLLNALDGDQIGTILNVLIIVVAVAQYILNPATKPKNVARSVEASRQIIGGGDPPAAPISGA